MTLPSPDEVAALLTPVYTEYNALHDRLIRLSLVDVLVITRSHFPNAAFLHVDETDQDMSGTLVATDEDIRDANDEPFGPNDDQDPEGVWSDDVWDSLSNLNENNQPTWQPFFLQDDDGRNWRLDLNAIERAVPELLG
jgi:hypothetical protein